tara:strand:+ start:9745 stop:11187 length:1443 start_codon:yes stop_codon:yes gene_type:complete
MHVKKIVIPVLLLFLIPLSFANIDISTNKATYNLGDEILIEASAVKDTNFEGMISLRIICPNKAQQFFLRPISLEANYRTTIPAPELKVDKLMLGNCSIRSHLLLNDKPVSGFDSDIFKITDQLTIIPSKQNITAYPDDIIQLNGIVEDSSGKLNENLDIFINFNQQLIDSKSIQGDFTSIINIPKTIQSGLHIINLSTRDTKLNQGHKLIELFINPTPSNIELSISTNNPNPGDKITITPTILDQHNDPLDISMFIELSTQDKRIFKKQVTSNIPFDYEINQFDLAQSYSLRAFFENLQEFETFTVAEKREAFVEYRNESVYIENIGNVVYEEEFEFNIDGDNQYTVTEKVKLQPGESTTIDLPKKVEQGTYDVTLENIDDESIVANIYQTAKNLTKTNLLANKVSLSDARPVHKKLSSGFSSVTGAIIGVDGIFSKNPFLAPILLITLIIFGVVYYSKGKVLKIFSKKKNKKDEIFDD